MSALSTGGIEDIETIDGTFNGESFTTFIEENILPMMQPFNGTNPRSILMLDNASIHHIDKVTELVTSIGAIVRFLPALSRGF